MSHTRGQFSLVFICTLLVAFTWADILVNINVNKPIHDVDEQFVSYSIPPELLFSSLDGPNKKTFSDMANLLGPSYLKLNGDYFFPTDLKSNLKNPTQSIWSGFNRWTRAMNWTMIIPVQYTPLTWDPIDALRVLNTSNSVGIENCIWQLGLDFGASRAAEYVADLNTLDTMVDTFRPYVKSWKVIGADITAGSSAEETKRYIEMSSDVNTAFGWTQPAGYHIEENVNGYIYDKDPSLKAMMEKKVPIWLSLPSRSPVDVMPTGYSSVEESEGLRWAQTLGDAASSGFNAIFKPLSKDDVRSPNYSFFVSALFKKIMGNRVFASKPVKRSSFNSKLYTHCANGISGGIAFMTINTEETPVKISARPSAKFTGSEVWQFILTSKKGSMFLNNEELSLNSTLEPFVRIKHPNKPLSMPMPPMSVGFWVLPLANHEDCQFTELLASFNQDNQLKPRQRKQTSTDRLLKKLILETSVTDQIKNRRRRDTSSNALIRKPLRKTNKLTSRHKRFILQDAKVSAAAPSQISPKLSLQERNLKKREDAENWLKSLMKPVVLPGMDWNLKRSRRGADFISSLFPGDNPVPVIGNIRKQSRLSAKEKQNDEANIFRKGGENALDLPEGDVHFRYITGTDGEEIQVRQSKEEIEEERDSPLSTQEFPSEFYETIVNDHYQPKSYKGRMQSKSKKHQISDIDGPTKYMTRKQLQSKFDEIHKEFTKSNTEKPPTDDYDSKTAFEAEYTPRTNPETLEKYLYESDETDSSKPYFDITKRSKAWEIGERAKRSIDFGKLKSWQDNLISDDEREHPLSQVVPEMSETIQNVANFEGIQDAASSLTSQVSKIFNAVKDRLSSFFSSLTN